MSTRNRPGKKLFGETPKGYLAPPQNPTRSFMGKDRTTEVPVGSFGGGVNQSMILPNRNKGVN